MSLLFRVWIWLSLKAVRFWCSASGRQELFFIQVLFRFVVMMYLLKMCEIYWLLGFILISTEHFVFCSLLLTVHGEVHSHKEEVQLIIEVSLIRTGKDSKIYLHLSLFYSQYIYSICYQIFIFISGLCFSGSFQSLCPCVESSNVAQY